MFHPRSVGHTGPRNQGAGFGGGRLGGHAGGEAPDGSSRTGASWRRKAAAVAVGAGIQAWYPGRGKTKPGGMTPRTRNISPSIGMLSPTASSARPEDSAEQVVSDHDDSGLPQPTGRGRSGRKSRPSAGGIPIRSQRLRDPRMRPEWIGPRSPDSRTRRAGHQTPREPRRRSPPAPGTESRARTGLAWSWTGRALHRRARRDGPARGVPPDGTTTRSPGGLHRVAGSGCGSQHPDDGDAGARPAAHRACRTMEGREHTLRGSRTAATTGESAIRPRYGIRRSKGAQRSASGSSR